MTWLWCLLSFLGGAGAGVGARIWLAMRALRDLQHMARVFARQIEQDV